jgi:ABC-type molybdenum transport system ATPase subunit/photorepair protein PhrA
MKLAIARSMLWNARILLLDEPTNHLDKAAVAWLVEKINSLVETTVLLVSHDYDFLKQVRQTQQASCFVLKFGRESWHPFDLRSMAPECTAEGTAMFLPSDGRFLLTSFTSTPRS